MTVRVGDVLEVVEGDSRGDVMVVTDVSPWRALVERYIKYNPDTLRVQSHNLIGLHHRLEDGELIFQDCL